MTDNRAGDGAGELGKLNSTANLVEGFASLRDDTSAGNAANQFLNQFLNETNEMPSAFQKVPSVPSYEIATREIATIGKDEGGCRGVDPKLGARVSVAIENVALLSTLAAIQNLNRCGLKNV